jgi:hypothetical protein
MSDNAAVCGQLTDLLAWGQHRRRSSDPLSNGRRSVARGPPKRQDRRVCCWPHAVCWLRCAHGLLTETFLNNVLVCFRWFRVRRRRGERNHSESHCWWIEGHGGGSQAWKVEISRLVREPNVLHATRHLRRPPFDLCPPSSHSNRLVSFNWISGSPGTLVARAQLGMKLWTSDWAHFRLLWEWISCHFS